MSSALANSNPSGRRLCRPVNQALPHWTSENEWCVVKMAHLQQLPDHHRLEYCANAAQRHNKSIGQQYEMMQASEKSLMFKSLPNERIDLLFERQLHVDTNVLRFVPALGLFPHPRWRALHQASSPASHDVATHSRQHLSHAFNFLIYPMSGLGARRAENRDAVALTPGWTQASKLFTAAHRPKTVFDNDAFDRLPSIGGS